LRLSGWFRAFFEGAAPDWSAEVKSGEFKALEARATKVNGNVKRAHKSPCSTVIWLLRTR